ncbi:oligosaccharide flippase family protein [Brevibacillus ruminantium]|uniref:Oligosaccharide flippase family protein n=1 Tax=Brevibacillus ruminantium TaxID=2950604 RepID=A0ABY4WQZ1_9BACL|nr:oligosaccharide flippase family protein [Brevibacillus ruminantium]USG67834.1 oligosaccharide flippase family protein [Brevibacillus ruminantium]
MQLPAFLKQTVLRTGAIFLVKAIGLAVRIPLYRLLGSEGTGIYQIVYSIFGFALTLLTGGFPTTLALMTAKDLKRGSQLFKGFIIPFFILGVGSGLLCYTTAPYLAYYLGDSRLTFPIRCLAPALMIVPLLQLHRGFLQGIESYGEVSTSELIEQAVRAGTMLLLVVVWMKYGIYAAAGGAAFGAFTGAFVALCFLWLWQYNKKPMFSGTTNRTFTDSIRWSVFGPGIFFFLKTSFAITLTRLVTPTSDLLDALIIPARLQKSGLSQSDAVGVFGEITGMASITAYLPTILTAALSYTVASKLTANWQNKKRKNFLERSNISLEVGWFWGIGSTVFLLFYADELSILIFGNEGAAQANRYLSFAPIVVGMRELTTTILWAMDQKSAPLIGSILGLICSAFAAYYLTAIPGFGYAGAAISVFTFEFIPLIWNVVMVQKRCKGAFPVTNIVSGSLFLLVIAFFYTPFDALLLRVGLDSAIIRSLGGTLFFTICIFLYIFFRFRKKTGGR